MISLLKVLYSNDEGATMVEYGLIIALIAVVCIAAVIYLGETLSDQFGGVANQI